jgi:hypothetical protein
MHSSTDNFAVVVLVVGEDKESCGATSLVDCC